jgi:hypothetical protein
MRILRFIRSIFCHHWYVEGHKHFYPGLREHGDTHDTTIQDIKCRKCSAEALLRIETPIPPDPVKWSSSTPNLKED